MNKNKWLIVLLLLLGSGITCAQVEGEDEEEDYSAYEDWDTDEAEKRYCGPKVKGLSPAKLVSIGYDFAGPHSITAGAIGEEYDEVTENVSFYHGTRVTANLPIISRNSILINVGANIQEARYTFESDSLSNPFHRALDQNIRTVGLNTTIFKPFNEKHFALGYYMAEYSGNYTLNQMQPLSFVKHTMLGVFGWKFNDNYQLAVGATQSYRAGEVNFFPILMYNYTAPDANWGIEMLAPARAHFRYRFSAKSLIMAGVDLEGTSFHISQRSGLYPDSEGAVDLFDTDGNPRLYDPNQIELRRSEIRLNVKYEKAITDFIWISAQVGYAMNYRSDVDNGEFFRGFFREDSYVQQNNVGGAPYVQFSINLVSP
jgi:hypothetical protein